MSADAPDHEAELEKVCRSLEEEGWKLPMCDKASRLLREMDAENKRLRGALKPFAALAPLIGSCWTDETMAFRGSTHGVTIGSIRRAAEALTKGKPHD